jgi:hypothetical protein
MSMRFVLYLNFNVTECPEINDDAGLISIKSLKC